MGSYTIGQVAERSGIPATSLRYYEGIGLVPPTGRTPAGYRLYDDRTLARLAFIARAKQLGCSLDEITDLVEVWDGDRCGPVQRRFHELVTAKLRAADEQLAELTAFRGQLRAAATQLSGEPSDGPCDDGCACLHEAPAAATAVVLGSKPDEVPIACTLAAGDIHDRLDAWDQVRAGAVRRLALPSGGLRVEFGEAVDVESLARLVVAEQACCAFFQFAITVDHRGVALEVDAPAEAHDLNAGLFGTPS
jgi:MerR family transcriptional regulator, copper efflux regulator